MEDAPIQKLYLGNLPRNATKQDVESLFAAQGYDKLTNVKLMNGFGFVDYQDRAEMRPGEPGSNHPTLHDVDFMGDRLAVQYARGQDRPPREYERPTPRPRRTVHRMTVSGLPSEASWQDLKDFARNSSNSGLDVVYSEVSRDRSNPGSGFVEYETAADLATAVDQLDGVDFKGGPVRCLSDPQSEVPRGPPRERYRSRSPPPRRGGYGPPRDDYDYRRRASPPRRYNDGGYRERSPPPRGGDRDRDPYERRGPPRDFGRSPPPRAARAPPAGDNGYGPPARGGRYSQDDSYGGAPPAGRRGFADGPYANGNGGQPGYGSGGHGREPYGRPASPPPRRDRGYGGGDDYCRNY